MTSLLILGLIALALAFRIYDLFWGATARAMRTPKAIRHGRLNALEAWGDPRGPRLH